MRKRQLFLPAFLLFIWMAAAGCEQPFEPLQENDRYFFSIYGYLDAAADTNWVRVMPVREQLFMEPEPINATVTIEDLNGDSDAVMNDSLFHYGDEAYVYNFWTTMDLEPGRTYRITAEKKDGRASRVDVRMPEDFPPPLVNVRPRGSIAYDQIYIEGVENLADASSFHHMRHMETGVETKFSFTHLQDTSYASDRWDYLIEFDDVLFDEFFVNHYSWDPEISLINVYERIEILHRQLFIASAGPDWHHFSAIDENVIALPDGVSNVDNGVGYVVGIVSKTVPYESCYDDNHELIPCPLEKPMRGP